MVAISRALIDNGVRVSMLTWRWPQPVTWPELDPRVNIWALPTARYYAARFIVPFYVAHLWRHRYDMVYIHFADYGEAAALNTLHLLRRPQTYSIVFHFPYSQVPHRYETLASSNLVACADTLIAVSDFVAREAQAFLSRSCAVIPHGVDTKVFQPDRSRRSAVRAELDVSPEAPMLLTVAALEERKGVQWVLRVLPLIMNEVPDVVYVAIGDGPYRPRLEGLANELGITDQVRFLSARADVARYYQAADLMVILSKGEASSLVSLEAMACELPVIASMHPPFDELIAPEWGCQVDEMDTQGLADTVTTLFSDPERRRCMGQAGRAHVMKRHTWDRVAQQYLDLLK
jgi:glycosyltransferase involved in cell wall biosynthesis